MSLAQLLIVALIAASSAPQDPTAAWAAWQRGDRAAALELAAQELAASPADVALRRTLAEWQLATHHHAAALETTRGNAELASITGRALYLLGRHSEALEQLSADDPLDAVLRVDACEALGDDEATWRALQRAEALSPDAAAQLACVRGRLLARAGRHEAAAESFGAALATDPLSPGAHFGLGRSLLSLGRRDEALVILERHRELVPLIDARDAALRALDLAPRHGPNHAQIGDVERALGRLDVARAAYERATELATAEQLAPIVLRHARLLAEDLDDLDAAVALLDEVARAAGDGALSAGAQPADSAALTVAAVRLSVRAGDLLASAGRWSESAERFERAKLWRPDDATIDARLVQAREQAAQEHADPGHADR